MKCYLCPRKCGVDRESGKLGICKAPYNMNIARISLHMWEEPSISGENGSGTVFFGGCPLGCIYCQNYKISSECSKGREYSYEELSEELLKLQKNGANNINFVTPTHYSLHIIETVRIAKNKGLNIPIIYNCSGYERVETLKLLKDTVDIYLTDFKYMDDELATRYSNVKDYSEVAKAALHEMVSQQPEAVFDNNGMMQRGVIVRNLLLPGNVNNSKAVVKYVYETYKDKVFLSLMNQYTPLSQVADIIPLNRKVTKREYMRLVDYAINLGVKNAYIQDGEVASESFIPDF